jgi:DNA-binding phage protein
MITEELKKLKSKLPCGAITAISKESGLSQTMIQRVLSGKSASLDNVPKVLNAVADYLEIQKQKEKEATDRVKAVMNKYI